MEPLKTSRIDAVMKRISDTVPVAPAAGSAAALTGAAAAALGCFVSHLSARHTGDARIAVLLQKVGDRFAGLRETCLGLMDADVEAYTALVQAIRDTEADETDDALSGVSAARKDLLEPPMKLIDAALSMLKLSRLLMRHAYPSAYTDAAVSRETARGCLESALLIAEENISALKDREMRRNYRKTLEKYRSRGKRLSRSRRTGR